MAAVKLPPMTKLFTPLLLLCVAACGEVDSSIKVPGVVREFAVRGIVDYSLDRTRRLPTAWTAPVRPATGGDMLVTALYIATHCFEGDLTPRVDSAWVRMYRDTAYRPDELLLTVRFAPLGIGPEDPHRPMYAVYFGDIEAGPSHTYAGPLSFAVESDAVRCP